MMIMTIKCKVLNAPLRINDMCICAKLKIKLTLLNFKCTCMFCEKCVQFYFKYWVNTYVA